MNVIPHRSRSNFRSARRPLSRRGFTVLVVLALISITLALSYSIMRSQMTGIQIQSNSDRGNLARQAALAGVNVALRNMRLTGWTGVGTPLTASISSTDSYTVTFTAGDPSLTSSNPNYSDYPYRVMVLSTGTSVDPAHSTVSSTYKVQAIVRLIARQLTAAPSNYATMLGYTLYEMTSGSDSAMVPCHIDGPVRLQGALDVHSGYNWKDAVQKAYYSDLNAMRNGSNEVQTISRVLVTGGTFTLTFNGATTGNIAWNASTSTLQTALQNLSTIGAGNVLVTTGGTGVWVVTFVGQLAAKYLPVMTVNTSLLLGVGMSFTCTITTPGSPGTPDYRPFSGPITFHKAQTSSNDQTLLTNQLGVTLIELANSNATALPISSSQTYRLYPGGPLYNFGQLPASVANTTLGPDPVSNPLGIFYNSASATLGNNVTITGTVISVGDLTITGTNVNIVPFSLQPLEGTSTPIRLPSVMTLANLHITSAATATINGVVYAGNQLLVDQGTETTALAITGNVIIAAGNLTIMPRTEWQSYSPGSWDNFYSSYQAQLGTSSSIPFFPQWLAENESLIYIPLLTIKADPTPLVQQWQDFGNPIYVTKTGDSGLHWDLVSWADHL
ncbi:MAG: hypothetical protein HY288_16180 [Planctomycetia bacterium]|nr:hypothetical protein [Planctomycetia bacterium]